MVRGVGTGRQDISIGYDGHDNDKVKLYFTESFMYRIIGPEAVTVMKTQAYNIAIYTTGVVDVVDKMTVK
ncbi:MAG: hypothetical protein P1P82_14815 [Bacteroidales bacterium]|nr:hypothetical protein [Bacteroidales bacterium]MDT8432595.1 hypothetical protein [Bacteroidales bacterium]